MFLSYIPLVLVLGSLVFAGFVLCRLYFVFFFFMAVSRSFPSRLPSFLLGGFLFLHLFLRRSRPCRLFFFFLFRKPLCPPGRAGPSCHSPMNHGTVLLPVYIYFSVILAWFVLPPLLEARSVWSNLSLPLLAAS